MSDSGYTAQRDLNRQPLWSGKAPLLGHLDMELTERCNNACVHCCINRPADDPDALARELTTAEWQGILRQAADLGALSVRLTGGEPLLRPDFADLYVYARRLGLRVTLYTNGRLITPQLADLFARIPPRDKIEITVYGMHAETYEATTCAPGSFAQFRAGVDLLLDRHVPFVVKGVLLPGLRAEEDELAAWAATIPSMAGPVPYSMFFELRGRRDSETLNRRIRRLRVSPEEGLARLARDPASYRREMAEFCGKFMAAPGDGLFGCGAGQGGCVDAYGMYQPCMGLRAPDLAYDLRHGTLRDGLTQFFPRVLQARATSPAYLERCARCFLKGLCEQCPARSWAEHGTLDTPIEYLCDVAHAQARYLGLLAADEHAWEVADPHERLARLAAEVKPAGGPSR